jgi:hypothetical protein
VANSRFTATTAEEFERQVAHMERSDSGTRYDVARHVLILPGGTEVPRRLALYLSNPQVRDLIQLFIDDMGKHMLGPE